jgi:hypothetical protein
MWLGEYSGCNTVGGLDVVFALGDGVMGGGGLW